MDRPNNWSRISNHITGQQRLPLSELSLIIIQCQTKQQKLKNIDVKVVLFYFIFSKYRILQDFHSRIEIPNGTSGGRKDYNEGSYSEKKDCWLNNNNNNNNNRKTAFLMEKKIIISFQIPIM